jgi:hypothetical protein
VYFVAKQDGAAFLLHTVGGADLNQLRFRGDGLGNVRVYLGLIVSWVAALCGIWANRSLSCWLLVATPAKSGRYPVRILAALYGRLRQPTSDSAR